MHEWLSGGVSPCQGEGRGFESRLVLSKIQKRDIRWMSFFCMFKPCRARTVRMSAFHSGRRRRTSPGRSATSRALKDTKQRHPMDVFFCMFKPCRARTVRMSTLRCGRRRRTSPGPPAMSPFIVSCRKQRDMIGLYICWKIGYLIKRHM